MDKKENIALIGMPGSGKSTVGVFLAKSLHMHFVDTDALIKEREGMSLADIISNKGSAYFSSLEEAVVTGLSGKGLVIATGGSVVLLPKAMEHLAKIARVVYLEADLWLIKRRLWNFKTRGIVASPDMSIERLFHVRRPLYRHYAEITVRVRRKRPDRVAADIVEALNRKEDPKPNAPDTQGYSRG